MCKRITKKVLSVMKLDDIELEYLAWAVQFTLDHTAEDSEDYIELINLRDYCLELKNDRC